MIKRQSNVMHIPVLLNEVIEGLQIQPNDVFVDGTLGAGSHSEVVAKTLGEDGTLVGLDLDADALNRASVKLIGLPPKIILRQENFRNLDKVLEGLGIKSVDKILLDLGMSSNQLEESGRGFSFMKSEPLLMTMSDKQDEQKLIAKDIVNFWGEENIAEIIHCYGEERFSRRIANAIVLRRKIKPIETTDDLREIIWSVVPNRLRHGRIHPATRTFQALRIAVNDELESLKEVLAKGLKLLDGGGRMAVISFHSLEDRIVKNFMRDAKQKGNGVIHTKKPIVPKYEEVKKNPRSRSAKLRIFEKIDQDLNTNL